MDAITADFCEFTNKFNETINLFVLNVSDPVQEFWEKKTLQQSSGVSLFLQSIVCPKRRVTIAICL